VDGNAKATGDKAHDGVAGQRAAALGKLDGGVIEALYHHAVCGVHTAQVYLGQILHRLILLGLGSLELLPLFLELGQAVGNGHAAVADGGVQLLRVVLAHPAGAAVNKGIQLVVRDDDHLPAQLLGQGVPSLLDILLPAHLLEPVADLALGFAGAHDLEPIAAGALVCRAQQHLNDLAGRHHMVDGHHAVVHLAAHHAVAHRRMDGVGKVDAGGAGGQVDDITLGGKGEHLFRQQVAL